MSNKNQSTHSELNLTNNDNQKKPWHHEENLRLIMSWVVVISIAIFVLVTTMYIIVTTFLYSGNAWHPIAFEQLPTIVGLPMASTASVFIVLILRLSSGPIEFEIGPLKFKGGAAPIVFWILCYLSIALTIKMMWLPADEVLEHPSWWQEESYKQMLRTLQEQ